MHLLNAPSDTYHCYLQVLPISSCFYPLPFQVEAGSSQEQSAHCHNCSNDGQEPTVSHPKRGSLQYTVFHLFYKYLLSIFYVLDTVLNAMNTVVHRDR